jgi:hypothetical protein
MPDGVYAWTINFPSITSPNWRGSAWTGGDPTSPLPGWPGNPSAYDSANVYASVSSFKAEEDGTMGRRKHLFVGLHAVMIDDVGTKADAKRALVLPPSYYVETSPGNFQSWLFLDVPEMDRGRAEALIDSMVRDGLAAENDPGMRGVSRVGRPPFGHNDKAKYVEALGKPFDVRLVGWHPERRYSVEQIIKAYGLTLEKPHPKYAGPPPTQDAKVTASKDFVAILKGIERLGLYKREKRNGWHEITCPWVGEHDRGLDDGADISPPCAENGWRGGYKCHHGHCEKRRLSDVRNFLFVALAERVRSKGGAK